MQFYKLAVILATAAVASAQTICSSATAAVPTCGQACLASAASVVGCASTDLPCQCAPSASAAIASNALLCVVNACGVATALQVSTSASAVCTACPVA